MSQPEHVIAYVTVPSTEVAAEMSKKIVENKLAACVTYSGTTSVYTWEGKVETSSEQLMMIKTRASLAPELTTFIKGIHPYSVPEVIFTPILYGNPDYLAWIASSTKEGAK
eukprot:tig00000241_g20964.t1